MATKIEIVEFTSITTETTQDVSTSVGFGTPQCVLFILGGDNVVGQSVYDHGVLSFSAVDASRQGNVSATDENGAATTDTGRRHDDDWAIYVNDENTSAEAAATATLAADKVTLTWGVNDLSTGIKITAIFITGTTNIHVGWALVGNQDVQMAISAPGFEPDVVIMAGAGEDTSDGSGSTAILSLGFGVNDGSDTQRAITWTSETGEAAGDPGVYVFSNRIGSQTLTGGVTYSVEIDNYNANGFDLYARGGDSGDYFLYIAIETELSVWCGSIDSPTSTGSDAQTGVGFQPDFLMLAQTMAQTEDSLEIDADGGALGISVMDGSLEQSWAIASEDAAATTNTESSFDDVAISLNKDDGTAAFDASFTSFDSDGWTLNYSVADGTARKWIALAIGSAAAGGGAYTASGAVTPTGALDRKLNMLRTLSGDL